MIPWFCIAHPLLRITLRHPIWRKRKLPARLATTKGAFAGAYPCTKQVEEKTAKIWEHKSPDREEVCFENLTKISGRCVVELDLLAEALDRGCNTCAKPLQLSRITDETVSGLGSFLYIMCSNPDCGELNICQTSKTHRVPGRMRGRPIFDVNTKLAAGLLRDFVTYLTYISTDLYQLFSRLFTLYLHSQECYMREWEQRM